MLLLDVVLSFIMGHALYILALLYMRLFYKTVLYCRHLLCGKHEICREKMILATHPFVISQLFVTIPHLVLNVFGPEQIDSSLSLTVNTVNNSAAVMNSNNGIII